MAAQYVIVPSPNATLSFTLGAATAVSFECQVTLAAITSTPNSVTVPATGCAGATTRNAESSYALQVDFLQDWGQTESLSQFLWDNAGELVQFSLSVGPDAPVATGECQLVSGSLGGDFANPLTDSVTMPVTAKPTLTPPVAAAAEVEAVEADRQPVGV